MFLRDDIVRRNTDKWRSLPLYIDYLNCNFREELPLAVSIDIDGTILDEETKQIMPNCLDAIRYLKEKNVATFIITARSDTIRVDTINELGDVGIIPELYRELLMCDRDMVNEDHAEVKELHRNKIRESYSLVMAIGDRVHDLIQLHESDVAHYNLLLESLRQY